MIPPEQALLFTEDLHERFVTVALDGEEYYEVIRRLAERGLKGGIVYDALILHCASKSKADVIYTWNVEHFCRIAPEFQARIRTP
jgi:predicted nucleic acid-binding protein